MNRVNKRKPSLGVQHRENKGRWKMNKSETIGALAKALVQAISEMENASKNSVNPHFKSKYADLAEVIATTKPTLQKYGLAVAQFPCCENGAVGLETIILHDSGEWMSGTAYSPMTKQDPQAVGSAITYLRRYSLAAVCGLTQEDDDGNAASKPKPEQKAPVKSTTQQPINTTQAAPQFATKEQHDRIAELYKGAPEEAMVEDANGIFKSYAVASGKPPRLIKSTSELTPAMANYLIGQLEAMQKGAA